MRYRLRSLLILLAVGPPVLAGAWWVANAGVSHKFAINAISAVIAFYVVARVVVNANPTR